MLSCNTLIFVTADLGSPDDLEWILQIDNNAELFEYAYKGPNAYLYFVQ